MKVNNRLSVNNQNMTKKLEIDIKIYFLSISIFNQVIKTH